MESREPKKKDEILINGKFIEYKDCIHNHLDINLSFIDRLRVLIHGKIRLHNKIYTKEIVNVIKGETDTFVTSIYRTIFKSKQKFKQIGGVQHNGK